MLISSRLFFYYFAFGKSWHFAVLWWGGVPTTLSKTCAPFSLLFSSYCLPTHSPYQPSPVFPAFCLLFSFYKRWDHLKLFSLKKKKLIRSVHKVGESYFLVIVMPFFSWNDVWMRRNRLRIKCFYRWCVNVIWFRVRTGLYQYALLCEQCCFAEYW